MKRFLRLERLLTEEQLSEGKEKLKKISPEFQKTTLVKYNASKCQCSKVTNQSVIFESDGCTVVEKYCNNCIYKGCHVKQPEINTFNFDQFFDTIPEYREVLRQRYLESKVNY